ncbi:MAG: 50S ribosomal protein L29 [Parachlamydiales bacterium]|jgi:large subunit ribosomal protein L29
MSHIKEIRDLTKEQLEVMINDLNRDIFSLKNQLAGTRKLEKPHLLKEKKKDRARALLVLAEKSALAKKQEGKK